MLTTSERITLTGKSMIDGDVAENYTAVISTDNTDDMSISSNIVNQDLRKANKEQCRADRCEFEDQAYALQDSLNSTKVEKEE